MSRIMLGIPRKSARCGKGAFINIFIILDQRILLLRKYADISS